MAFVAECKGSNLIIAHHITSELQWHLSLVQAISNFCVKVNTKFALLTLPDVGLADHLT